MFVDEARVHTTGGRGGDGAATFHREKYRSKGGPDGGSGGRGGSVILEADQGTGSLVWLADHPHQRAQPGGKGARNNKTGADGEDLVLRVPVGTVVKDDYGNLLADLGRPGDRFVAARGGRGGKGNAALMTRTRRAPGFAELGEPAEDHWLKLELRLIADVAVIGYPNAGKSTLVSAVSAARPKVADYPFTTLDPSLGVVEVGDDRFTICDIPGLIEGAHEGKGLGIKFLRHAERAMVFLHLIDLLSETDPLDDYRMVRHELSRFEAQTEPHPEPGLASRPEVIALNKCDATDQGEEVSRRFSAAGHRAHVISAERGDGLDTLIVELHGLVSSERESRVEESFRLYRTEPETIEIKREDHAWRVTGTRVEKWVAMTDLNNPEAVAYLQDRIDSAGVEKLLADRGAKSGDEVRIGKSSFEWIPKEIET